VFGGLRKMPTRTAGENELNTTADLIVYEVVDASLMLRSWGVVPDEFGEERFTGGGLLRPQARPIHASTRITYPAMSTSHQRKP
jgi:hypothetical protein